MTTTTEPNVTGLVAQCRALEIESKDDYHTAVEMVRELRAMRAQVEGTFAAPKAAAHGTHKAIIAAEKPFVDALAEAEGKLLLRLAQFVCRAEARAIEKTRESRVFMLRDAEADRVRTAATLIADGNKADALALFDAPLSIEDPTWPADIPKIPGVSVRHSFKADIVDPDLLLKWAVAEGRALELFAPIQKELDSLARELGPKDGAIPGVLFLPTVTLAISEKKK